MASDPLDTTPSAEPAATLVSRRRSQGQLDFSIEFFDHVLRQNPRNVDVLRVQANLLSMRGEVDRALQLDRRLVQERPYDETVHYNLACSLALNGRRREALDALHAAVELGYDDAVQIEHDADLATLRPLPAFRQLLTRLQDGPS